MKRNKRITLIALVIMIFGIVIFLMRPIFSPLKEESLAIFINNQPQNKLPTSKNYEVNVNCQTSEGYWDYNNWTLRVKNLNNTKEKCNLSFLEKYNISYELNGGRWIKESDNTYIFGKEYTLPTNVFSLNKTFLGWYDNPSFTGNAVTQISLGTTGNKKYYAKYIINYQSINFLSLIGTGSWDGVKHSNGTWTFQYFQEGN